MLFHSPEWFAARVFGEVRSVNPSYHSHTTSATWVKFADYGRLAGWLLLALPFLGCSLKPECVPESHCLAIVGSSMEPRFHGERLECECETCKHPFFLASDTVEDRNELHCPRCWSQAIVSTTIKSDTVRVVEIDETMKLARYDCVVIEEPNSGRLEVKRIIGLPNESIRIVGGDVWVNGDRAKKSINQFLSQAVQIAEWAELSIGRLELHRHYLYSNMSLWPQTDVERKPHPSPILDDYPMIASESRWPSVVRDIGVSIQLSDFPQEPTEFKVEISRGDEKSVMAVIKLDPTPRGDALKRPNALIAGDPQGRSTNESPVITVAFVDGRTVASLGTKALPFQLVRDFSRKVTDVDPIGIFVSKGGLSIQKAHILRDGYYRGPHGD